jgi:hypothetical protein
MRTHIQKQITCFQYFKFEYYINEREKKREEKLNFIIIID